MQAVYEVLEGAEVPCAVDAFAQDVSDGLSCTPKSIPSLYFYDAEGSRLFQQITDLKEYYPAHCEREILQAQTPQIAAAISPGPVRLVELGAGDGRKTQVLLRQLLEWGLELEYVPIDICQETIANLTDAFGSRFEGMLQVRGLVAEYFEALAAIRHQGARRNLVLFLGSNIGNFSPHESQQFLRSLQKSLNPGDYALIGFDLKKDPKILDLAYNDTQGVTGKFNLNLLDRINRELEGHFDRRRFIHHGAYDVRHGRMESWLISREDQEVPIQAVDRVFSFRAWEGIHVECSYKYDIPQIEALAAATGFRAQHHFFDSRGYFVDSLWQAVEPRESRSPR